MIDAEAAKRAGELEVGDDISDLGREAAFTAMVFNDDEMSRLERGTDDCGCIDGADAAHI